MIGRGRGRVYKNPILAHQPVDLIAVFSTRAREGDDAYGHVLSVRVQN